ncbi:hypothetical protein AK812_SmicGene21365 [Symbiodinium microadriaticum]|uniref:Uncharacterized protein n=1 Tax=Symbiodinium microadriaticum TaxID=2951 RepID=A0A1Q9DML5_SYMMI|nr:hypothetical protein AK812_SmicGene21365 [Symbiodinium microadriaticum]
MIAQQLAVMWEVALQSEISTFKQATQDLFFVICANVRVLPSTGFVKLSDMVFSSVADAEHVQDAREKQVRSRVLEMQSRLMEAECRFIEDTLKSAVAGATA